MTTLTHEELREVIKKEYINLYGPYADKLDHITNEYLYLLNCEYGINMYDLTNEEIYNFISYEESNNNYLNLESEVMTLSF